MLHMKILILILVHDTLNFLEFHFRRIWMLLFLPKM